MSPFALLPYLADLFQQRRKHHGYGRRIQTQRVQGHIHQKPPWVKTEYWFGARG